MTSASVGPAPDGFNTECPKRGEIREINGKMCRFIERELEGDKWEVLRAPHPDREAEPAGGLGLVERTINRLNPSGGQIVVSVPAMRLALEEALSVSKGSSLRDTQPGASLTVLVPIEPTEAMLQGACEKHTPGQPMSEGMPECPGFRRRRRIWADMIEAAHQQEPGQ